MLAMRMRCVSPYTNVITGLVPVIHVLTVLQ